jgi:hypothetical protein
MSESRPPAFQHRSRGVIMSDLSTDEANPAGGATVPTLGEDARVHIGTVLQAIFASVEGEPIPNEHVYLLLALRRRERDIARSDN